MKVNEALFTLPPGTVVMLKPRVFEQRLKNLVRRIMGQPPVYRIEYRFAVHPAAQSGGVGSRF